MGFNSRALVESLQTRTLLSTTLLGGTLHVDASDGDDVVIVGLNKRFINILTVFENDEQKHFALAAIRMIDIRLLGGDDKVFIDSALDPLAYPTFIEGGQGNDSITTGAGLDTIRPGEGNDKVYSNGGADSVDGGAGNDSIWAGGGNDFVLGNAGNDRVSGEAGDDIIDTGKGNDFQHGGEGNDVLRDPAGWSEIFGGKGNDSGNVQGGGFVHGDDDNDNFVAIGGATLYGDAGGDTLQGMFIDGGADGDALTGLASDDEIHGGAGDDVIRGYDGADALFGDEGNDAIFGGVGDDTMLGGDGHDNLYGTNGYYDKYKELAGHDDGFGEAGSDWFETDYRWNRTDRRKGEDRPVNSQNPLPGDSSAGLYLSGDFYGGVTVSAGSKLDIRGSNYTLGSGAMLTSNVTHLGTGTLVIAAGSTIPTTIETLSLGDAGWLSSGAWDVDAEKFVPPPMSHSERLKAKIVGLQLPAGWKLGEITTARDDVVWYQVYRENAPKPVNGQLQSIGSWWTGDVNLGSFGGRTFTLRDGIVRVYTGGITPNAIIIDEDGTILEPADPPTPAEPMYSVPTLDGGTANVGESTSHLYDGVPNGVYRFLGVKRGTILVNGAGSTVTEATQFNWTNNILALPPDTRFTIGGSTTSYHFSSSYDDVPTGGPKSLKGILVDGGAIWLPTDGSAPYFSSGNN